MVLVQIVKLVQTRGMSGSRGNWKEFLNFHDKKIGASLCDPARRTVDDLIAFLKTFEQEDELKFVEKVLECYSIRDAMGQFHKDSPDAETPEQRLVRATVEHPRYPIEYSFPSYEEGWVVMKRSKKLKYLKSTVMVAIDCEMVLCKDGTEALARVCAVDRHLQVKLDKFVMPNKEIADYRTEITGIEAKDLEGVTLSLSDVQRSLKKILSHGSILVGHGLSNDLRALNLDHSRVIDTSYLFKYENERPNERPSLYNLCKVFRPPARRVTTNCQKLSDLDSIIPGDYTIEVKAKRPKAEKYSAFAIYKSQQEADEAFCTLESIQTADAIGRPQKSINIKTRSGMTAHIWVCKMGNGGSLDNSTSKKRLAKDEVGLSESKRSRVVPTNGEMKENDASSYSCDDHLKEIERLRKEIGERDTEIAHLNKIVVALTRKQGL
ncbi:hypothetical protein Leryth_008002 [Lithospermum erythrorhizon]|nr:hypothetical protein Leryth_008002 [Lithospermum erythrorhizon]